MILQSPLNSHLRCRTQQSRAADARHYAVKLANRCRQFRSLHNESGLDWVIGRNGIYIEPDIEYIETYKKMGGIFNCAGNSRCGHTTRQDLAYANARMLSQDMHSAQVYNLHGEAITQYQLAEHLTRL